MHRPLHLALIVAVGTLLAGAGRAQTGGMTGGAGTFTLTPSVVSHYLFRGVRFGGPAFQPTLEYVRGDLTAGVWASVPLDDKVPGLADPELDGYGSYAIPLTPAVALVVGATWYNFPRADEGAGYYRSTFEPNLALTYTVEGLRITPKVYYDVVLDGGTAELAAFYALPLLRWGTELDFTGTIGTFRWKDAVENSAPATKHWGDYWSLGVALPFQVSGSGRVTLGFAYAKGENHFLKQGTSPRIPHAAAAGRGVVSLGYSITF